MTLSVTKKQWSVITLGFGVLNGACLCKAGGAVSVLQSGALARALPMPLETEQLGWA